jgi:hypothetical protein
VVFVRGTDNAIWHRWQVTRNGDWSGWESVGASPGGRPVDQTRRSMTPATWWFSHGVAITPLGMPGMPSRMASGGERLKR